MIDQLLQQQLGNPGKQAHSLVPSQAHLSLTQFVQLHFGLIHAIAINIVVD